MSDLNKIERLVKSNANVISALSIEIAEMKQDRDYLSSKMVNLTRKIDSLASYQVQIDEINIRLENRKDQLDSQQQELADVFAKLAHDKDS